MVYGALFSYNIFIDKQFIKMRKIKISEEQLKAIVKEGVKISADANGNPGQAATKGAEAANKAGLDTVEVTGVNNSSTQTSTFAESKLISKKELKENRLKKLKENSIVVSVGDLFKK